MNKKENYTFFYVSEIYTKRNEFFAGGLLCKKIPFFPFTENRIFLITFRRDLEREEGNTKSKMAPLLSRSFSFRFRSVVYRLILILLSQYIFCVCAHASVSVDVNG